MNQGSGTRAWGGGGEQEITGDDEDKLGQPNRGNRKDGR